jgi:hypothetical protein
MSATTRNPLNEHAQAAQHRRRLAPEDIVQTETLTGEVDSEFERRRRERKPFGAMEQKLQFPERPGYHRHWFNDEPGRLLRAKEAGYDQVVDDRGQPVSTVVGISRGGGPLTAYLHEIPQDWYEEDMAAQEAAVLELRRQIEQGEFGRPKGPDGAARYAGSDKGSISIRESARR